MEVECRDSRIPVDTTACADWTAATGTAVKCILLVGAANLVATTLAITGFFCILPLTPSQTPLYGKCTGSISTVVAAIALFSFISFVCAAVALGEMNSADTLFIEAHNTGFASQVMLPRLWKEFNTFVRNDGPFCIDGALDDTCDTCGLYDEATGPLLCNIDPWGTYGGFENGAMHDTMAVGCTLMVLQTVVSAYVWCQADVRTAATSDA